MTADDIEREAIQGEPSAVACGPHLDGLPVLASSADDDDAGESTACESTRPESVSDSVRPVTPADVIARWRHEGPLVRIATGIAPLDDACRGGFPSPWRVVIVGAPAAGKTFIEIAMADALARACDAAGLCVGVLAVDEDSEDLTVRLAQIAGFTIAQAETRAPEILDRMERALCLLRIRLYDARFTIDAAAADLAEWAASQGRRAALFIDSAQTARSSAGIALDEPSLRQVVEANTATIREVATRYRMIVIATSEANRNAYRSEDAAAQGNDMAAGAESRTLEYSAQTLLMLRTPKDHRDVIHVRIAKNRRAHAGVDFWLRLDRDRHALTECPDPSADPSAKAEEQNRKRAGVKAEVARDAEALISVLRKHPAGIGEKNLRAEVKIAGLKWGPERIEAAKVFVGKGHRGVRLVDRGPGGKGAAKVWCLVSVDTHDTAGDL